MLDRSVQWLSTGWTIQIPFLAETRISLFVTAFRLSLGLYNLLFGVSLPEREAHLSPPPRAEV